MRGSSSIPQAQYDESCCPNQHSGSVEVAQCCAIDSRVFESVENERENDGQQKGNGRGLQVDSPSHFIQLASILDGIVNLRMKPETLVP